MTIKKRNQIYSTKKYIKKYAKKIFKQDVQIRKFDFKIRRDDKSLNFDYMIVRKKDVISIKHLFDDFIKNDNVCFHYDVYQYFEKCRNKSFDDKYWHCCVNDKILFDIMIFKTNFQIVTKIFHDFEKNEILRRDENLKYLNNFMYQIQNLKNNDSFARLIKRCKIFLKMTIIFNNVLSFINENANVNEINNVWITFRIMKSIHYVLNVLFVDSNDRRRFCQIYFFDFSQKVLLKRLIHDE